MYGKNAEVSPIHLSERESAQLASAVQVLIRELGFEPDEVERSYQKSFAYFMNTESHSVQN